MKETIVSLKTAKLAKKKKFNLYCAAWYGCDDPVSDFPKNKFFERDFVIVPDLWKKQSQKKTLIYEAPTLNILQQWLREKHNIFVFVDVDQTMEPKFIWSISKYIEFSDGSFNWSKKEQSEFLYRTHDKALEEGLIQGLKMI